MQNTLTLTPFVDKNGNNALKIKPSWFGRAFSIQTNQNLPETHRQILAKNLSLQTAHRELDGHLAKVGTKFQKRIFERSVVILKRG